jgi:hypothetical protein
MSWAHPQGISAFDTVAGTTYSLSLPATVGNGNMVCGRAECIIIADLTKIDDDKGNTYNLATSKQDGTNWGVVGFWLPNITNAPKTLTLHFSTSQTSNQVAATIDEFSGGGASAAIDQVAHNVQANPGTATGAVTSGSVATNVNGELIYGVAGSTTKFSPHYTAGTGYTQLEQATTEGGANPTSQFQVQSSAGSIAATWTDNTATDRSIATIMTFKPTAAMPSTARSFGVVIG